MLVTIKKSTNLANTTADYAYTMILDRFLQKRQQQFIKSQRLSAIETIRSKYSQQPVQNEVSEYDRVCYGI